jgi:uncharacterized protein YjbI with pentapeptide repeats
LAHCKFVPQYTILPLEIREKSKCKEDALDSGLCIFHDENYLKDKNNQAEHEQRVKKRIEEKVDYSALHDEELFCIGYHLPGINLQRNFTKGVYFSEANFYNVANFSKVNFFDKADFSSATFHKKVNFSQANFNNRADFYHTTFNNEADFSSTNFSENAYAYFYLARFDDAVTFFQANFNNRADFLSTKFSKDASADFSYTKFNKVRFFNITFNNTADFLYSNFDNTANFSGTTFINEANFSNATFSDVTFFSSTTFNHTADFSSTTFNHTVDFLEAKFNDDTFFSFTTFNHTANFLEAKFNDDTFFSYVNFRENSVANFADLEFNGKADFSYGKFHEARFNSTKFKETNFVGTELIKANFVKNEFDGKVTFYQSIFQEANFSKVMFNFDTDFKFVTFREGGDKILFDIEDLSKVSFMNSDITRVRFGQNTHWGSYDSFKTIDEENLEEMVSYAFKWKNISKKDKDKSKLVKFLKKIGIEDADNLIFDRLTNKKIIAKQVSSNVPFLSIEIDDNENIATMKIKDTDSDYFFIVDGRFNPTIYPIGKKEDTISIGGIRTIYRNLRENYEYSLRFEEADKFFEKEMEIKRKYSEKTIGMISKFKKNGWFKRNLSLTGLYNLISEYGKNYKRPIWLATIIVFIPILYSLTQRALEGDVVPEIGNVTSTIANITEVNLRSTFNIQEGQDTIGYFIGIATIPILGVLIIAALKRAFEKRFRH